MLAHLVFLPLQIKTTLLKVAKFLRRLELQILQRVDIHPHVLWRQAVYFGYQLMQRRVSLAGKHQTRL